MAAGQAVKPPPKKESDWVDVPSTSQSDGWVDVPSVNYTPNDWQGSVGHSTPSTPEPLLSQLGRPIRELKEGIVGGANDLLGMPGQVYHALADPLTDEERASGLYPTTQGSDPLGVLSIQGPMHKALTRMTVGQSLTNYRALTSKEKQDAPTQFGEALGIVPVFGPAAQAVVNEYRDKGFMSALGKAGVYIFTPRALGETKTALLGDKLPSVSASGIVTSGRVAPLSAMLDYAKTATQLSPETLTTKALNPSDKFFQKHVGPGLAELKAAQADLGKPITNPETAQAGLNLRTTKYNKDIAKIVGEQNTVVVPGSGAEMARQQIAKIPADLKNNPVEYEKVVNRINAYHPHDFTIGELNTLRSELGNTQSAYYGKDLSGALTMDAGMRATEIARGRTARALFYKGLDSYGLGGGSEAAAINSRIGSMIHWQDALQDSLNESVKQREPLLSRAGQKIRHPLTTTGLDNQLATAIERWKTLPEPINTQIGARVKGIAGAQSDLIPSMRGEPLFQNSLDTPSMLDLEEEYIQRQRQKRLWREGASKIPPITEENKTGSFNTPKGQFASPKGQLNLSRGMINPMDKLTPASTMSIGKTDVNTGTVPPGTKLAFKSKGMFGDMYHYETPDGRIITVDHELSPEILKEAPKTPYTPGTNTSKTVLNPPPSRTK